MGLNYIGYGGKGLQIRDILYVDDFSLLIKKQILSSINDCFFSYQNISNINFSSLHIWKYAKIKKIVIGKQIDNEFPIAVAGDFMEGPNIESAFISGEKAADLIFDRLS